MKTTMGMGAVSALLLASQASMAGEVEVTLNLKQKVPMEFLAEQVISPASSRYQRPYTPEEIRDLAGPTEAEYANLVEELNHEGLTVVTESKTRLNLTVRGEKETIERIFSTRLAYTDLSMTSHRALLPAIVPSNLGLIAFVGGLDSVQTFRPHTKVAAVHPDYPWDMGLSPARVKQLYNFNPIYQAGITGKGQNIAVAGYDGFKMADVTAYFSQSKISPAPQVDQVTFNGTPTYNENSAMETELDLEFSGMIAPGAQIHYFGSANNTVDGETQLFTAILDDNRSKIVNYSWGDCENNTTAAHAAEMNTVFARAVAQGVNIFAASGDSGSDGCRNSTVDADWPAANPYVVGVGGTTVNTFLSYFGETAWSDSGGGVSGLFALPSWQSSLKAPYVRRSFPDVAFNADPNSGENALISQSGSQVWATIGGTSIAAPQWSGFMALVNEARGSKGSLGFLNPAIYGMTATQRAAAFNDITSGSNGAYKAGAGWDAVTGWGSMKASQLLNYLKTL